MIEIEEASAKVAAATRLLEPISLATLEAVGCVLAEDVLADVDSPPHDKALVDGFAIRTADAGQELRVLELVVAGGIPTQVVRPGTCIEVMTGAPLPAGAEAMVMVEDTQRAGDRVKIHPSDVSAGAFIMTRGKVFSRHDVVLPRGSLLRSMEVGLLSEVGRIRVSCYRRPQVAVLPTGDELVSCTELPAAGKIRNSNGPMLQARVRQAGGEVIDLGVGRDEPESLRRQMERGLQADVLVLSGGVSAGVRDLVPDTLRALGVDEIFHKVRLKPGKPLWFGCRQSSGGATLVFGLPGNPVSSLVCFELFVLPAMRRLTGDSRQRPWYPVQLAEPFTQRGNRTTLHPGTLTCREGRLLATPLPWLGSADLGTVCRANCLIRFPAGDRAYQGGEDLDALRLE